MEYCILNIMWPSPLWILLLLHANLFHTTFPVSITLKNPYGYLDALDYPLMVFYAVILVGYICAPGSCVVPSAMLLLQGDCQTAGTLDVCCACTYIHTDVYVCMCMCLRAYMCVHVHVIVLSAAFMHLRIYFAVPHCSSRVVNCPGGSMFCCWACYYQ